MAIYRYQAGTVTPAQENSFYADVMKGLTATPKYLQSKYFYDRVGDRLFQHIMELPEYYLTRCEMEIFSHQTGNIIETLGSAYDEFDVVELGAGDATKSKFLLNEMLRAGFDFTYYPVDISISTISGLVQRLPSQLKGLKIHGLHGEYFAKLEEANKLSSKKKLVLFLGSSIGNYTMEETRGFLKNLSRKLNPGDLLLIGFDLKKHPKLILDAYNDKSGITREFNLNLLKRINRELNGNFNIHSFEHYPVYDPGTGACKSYLISLKKQQVHIGDRGLVQFEKDEAIFMEVSQKYSIPEINELSTQSGFKTVKHLFDSKKWFTDVIWEKV